MWKKATTSMSEIQNLVCLSLVVCSNTTLPKIQTVIFIFFPNSVLWNHGCSSSMGAAYLWMWLIHGMFTVIIVINQARMSKVNNNNKNTPCIRWLGINNLNKFEIVWSNSGLEQSCNSRPDASALFIHTLKHHQLFNIIKPWCRHKARA